MQEMLAAPGTSNSEATIVSIQVTVPQTKLALFDAGCRAAMCGALAGMAGVKSKQVLRSCKPYPPFTLPAA